MRLNLWGLVELVAEPAGRWADEVARALGPDVVRLGTSMRSEARTRVDVRFVERLEMTGLRELTHGVYVGDRIVADTQYGVRITGRPGVLRLEATAPALEWVFWGVALALLEAGATFVHCAGLARDGQAVLLPSWGGVGKTAIVAHLVRGKGYSLLGDDLVIVDRDGWCFPFPKPFVLYGYHRPLFPEVFEKGRGPMAPTALGAALSVAARGVKPLLRPLPAVLQLARRLNPQSQPVAPSDILGRDALAEPARLARVIWFERGGVEVTDRPIGVGDLATRILGSTSHEFDVRAVALTNVLFGVGLLGFEGTQGRWHHILVTALGRVDRRKLTLPADWSLDRVAGQVAAVVDRA